MPKNAACFMVAKDRATFVLDICVNNVVAHLLNSEGISPFIADENLFQGIPLFFIK